MEPESSLPRVQVPAPCPCPEPDQSSHCLPFKSKKMKVPGGHTPMKCAVHAYE